VPLGASVAVGAVAFIALKGGLVVDCNRIAAMRCTSCHAENPEGAKFCGSCGKALSRSCPKCGAHATTTSPFCTSTGSSLGVAADTGGVQAAAIALGTAVDAQYVPE